MKKLLCPQCKIAAMYVKNEQGDRLLVYVLEDGEVVPKYPEDSMEGFDLTEVFCLSRGLGDVYKRQTGDVSALILIFLIYVN